MSRPLSPTTTLTILAGQTTSEALRGCRHAQGVGIFAPATLTGTITVQVEPTDSGTDFVNETSGGTAVTIGASQHVTLMMSTFAQLRLKSSGAEAADRVFTLVMRQPA